MMFLLSFLIGAIVGCACSVCLRCLKSKAIILNRIQEIAVLFFFAFISYTLTEELGMSPRIALLFSGIFMSNYAFYNLSFQAREESSVVSGLLATIAEEVVFTYLGLTLLYYMTYSLSLTFIVIEFFIIILGRLVGIFGIPLLMCLFKVKSFKMKISEKGIMSCAGSIRGAISFRLAISIKTPNNTHKERY